MNADRWQAAIGCFRSVGAAVVAASIRYAVRLRLEFTQWKMSDGKLKHMSIPAAYHFYY